MARGLCCLIAIILAALLWGCGEKDDSIMIDLSGYTIVRPDYQPEEDVKLALSLKNRLTEAGADVGIKTDFLIKSQNEQPGESELLFGFTEREESKKAAEDYDGDENSFMVRVDGTKIVVLGGNRFSYEAAIDWLCENYGEKSGGLRIPTEGYYGRWTPEFADLTFDGTPIGEFSIVTENLLGFGLSDAAERLSERLFELTGAKLQIVSSESEPTEHEIFLGSDGDGRGEIRIVGENREEFAYKLDKFLEGLGKGEVEGEIAMNNAILKTIEISGKSPAERGRNLTDALEKISRDAKNATAGSPCEFVLTLSGGEYDLPGGLTFGENPFAKLTIKAADESDRPVLTGLVRIPDECFTKVEGTDYYMAKLEADSVRDFYVGTKRIPIATGERGVTVVGFDDNSNRAAPENTRGIYVDKSAVEMIKDFGSTEFNIYVEWEAFTLRAAGVDYSDARTVDGHELVRLRLSEKDAADFPVNVHTLNNIKNRIYFLANNREFLTPGTCVVDYENGILYYYPESGAPKDVAYSTTDVILQFENASGIRLENLDFTGTACSVTAKDGYYAHQANGEKRYGDPWFAAVNFRNSTDIAVEGCSFYGLNGSGVRCEDYIKSLRVGNCEFTDIAMSAVSVGNYVESWGESNACYDIVINNNDISYTGTDYPTATSIYVAHADGLKITHNSIDNCAYSGISAGWGWAVVDYDYGEKINLRNAEIAYNRITNFMEKLRDGAAIYVLGANCTEKYTGLFNTMHDNYAEKADYKPDTGHICGYYLDGSSSNWHVYDNVIAGAKYPLFTQFHVKSQYNHNVLCERIYSASPIDKGNHCPDRNVMLGETFVSGSLDELFEEYPAAKRIHDASGANK